MKKLLLVIFSFLFIHNNYSIGNKAWEDVKLKGVFTKTGINIHNKEYKLYLSGCVVQSYYVATPTEALCGTKVTVEGDTACSPGWIHGPVMVFKYKNKKYKLYEDNVKDHADLFNVDDIHGKK